jgi:hypothetical protein
MLLRINGVHLGRVRNVFTCLMRCCRPIVHMPLLDNTKWRARQLPAIPEVIPKVWFEYSSHFQATRMLKRTI